jgi:hypothetical protein
MAAGEGQQRATLQQVAVSTLHGHGARVAACWCCELRVWTMRQILQPLVKSTQHNSPQVWMLTVRCRCTTACSLSLYYSVVTTRCRVDRHTPLAVMGLLSPRVCILTLVSCRRIANPGPPRAVSVWGGLTETRAQLLHACHDAMADESKLIASCTCNHLEMPAQVERT